jgi:uncharacterized membrane protein YgdD (TMEM256/DUF423 family)
MTKINFQFSLMNKLFLLLAAIFGALAVIAGALLAHQLKQRMPEAALEVYETAVLYQFYHVFALLAAGILSEKFHNTWIHWSCICFILGIGLFSGSLYIISAILTTGGSVPVALGICTPLGGLGFILGWIFLSVGIWKGRFS